MGSKVTIDSKGVSAKLKKMSEASLKAVADQMLADSRQYVPKQEGILRDSARVEMVGTTEADLIWDTPYAAYQYYGCWPDGSHQVVNHTTAGTTTFWVDEAAKKNLKKWEQVAEDAAKKL